MTDSVDARHMARAIALARNGVYSTDPNPTVGCVIAHGADVVAEGWTAPTGRPHAERVALAAAGPRAAGACVYVSLEPCSHEGRTGPCAKALIDARVSRVVCAVEDPNPLVAGRGIAQLRAAGIVVDVGLLEAPAAELNRGFFSRMSRGRPWVRTKIAASLDGRTALANGRSQWITSAAARADGHRWRARSSAILTGIETVLADDPSLDARIEKLAAVVHQPCRVIVDSRLRTPATAQLLRLGGETIIFTTSDDAAAAQRLVAAGADIERVAGQGRVNLAAVLARLAERELNDVWVEAGATLNGALLAQGLVDEIVFYFAPMLLGDDARGMFSLGRLAALGDGVALAIDDVRPVGPDLRIVAHPTSVTGPVEPAPQRSE
jgi:diaminohydroxyphosphoribosylaminopyrimidine deaminase/5-amino-6-(5-phosphoribosylamino)uracil reductase